MEDFHEIDEEQKRSHDQLQGEAQCMICQDVFPPSDMFSCNDDTIITSNWKHFMCSDCFLGYANVELAGGAFEGVRYFGGDSSSTLISSPGNLPCPKFITGDCDTAAIPLTTLFGVFQRSNETAKLYYLASRRIIYHEVGQDLRMEALETQQGVNAEGNIDNDASLEAAIEAIKLRVLEALNRGAIVKCPECHQPGIKNAHCIHIRCHLCGTSWCYCCGRTRESTAISSLRCKGCDAFDSRLEMQPPNWNSFAIGSESPPHGALHEFHRQRQAYFVQDVKMSTIPYQWLAFQAANPNFLNDVPTPGRCIRWEELDVPIEPPVFGHSTSRDLLWAIPPRIHLDESAQVSEGVQGPQIRQPETIPETVLQPWVQVFCSHRGLGWISLLVATAWMYGAGFYFDLFSKGFWIAPAFMSSSLFFYTALFMLQRIADYFELHPNCFVARLLPEVTFVGRRHRGENAEGPYFSASGRWRQDRRNRLARPLLGFSIGIFLLSISLLSENRFVGAGSLVLLVPIINTAMLQTVILNFKPLPPLTAIWQPLPFAFSQMMNTLWCFQVFTGLGAAFIHNEIDTSTGISGIFAAGVFLIMLGVGLTLASVLPRIFAENFYAPRPLALQRSRSFWIGLLIISFCLWFYFFVSEEQGVTALIIGPILCLNCWLSMLSPQAEIAPPRAEPAGEGNAVNDGDPGVELVAQPGNDADGQPDIMDEADANPGNDHVIRNDDIDIELGDEAVAQSDLEIRNEDDRGSSR